MCMRFYISIARWTSNPGSGGRSCGPQPCGEPALPGQLHEGKPYTTSPVEVPMYTRPWLMTGPLYVFPGRVTFQSSRPVAASYACRIPIASGMKMTPPAAAAAENDPVEGLPAVGVVPCVHPYEARGEAHRAGFPLQSLNNRTGAGRSERRLGISRATQQAGGPGSRNRADRRLRFPLHGDRDRPAVELDPRDLDRVHDARRHIDEDRGTHADLERPRSDDSSFLKSRVPHRVSLAPGRGRREVHLGQAGPDVGGPNRVPILQPCSVVGSGGGVADRLAPPRF